MRMRSKVKRKRRTPPVSEGGVGGERGGGGSVAGRGGVGRARPMFPAA